jgi:hypothetical protein
VPGVVGLFGQLEKLEMISAKDVMVPVMVAEHALCCCTVAISLGAPAPGLSMLSAVVQLPSV